MRETASKSALLLSGCLRWAHPASRWYSDRPEDAEAREDGTLVHEALHLHANGLPYSVQEHLANKVAAAAKYLDEELLPRVEKLWTEVVLGINIKTGETVMLENVTGRAYPESDEWFYGTADILAVLKSGSILAGDWKTGAGDGAEEQLLTLGLVAQRTLKPDAVVRIAPLYIADDEVFSGEREVAQHELEEHLANLRKSISSAREKVHLPVAGTHCTQLYCPHLAFCPATHSLLDEMAHSGDEPSGPASDSFSMDANPVSSRHAGWMAARLRAVKRATKFFEGSVKDYVRAGNRAVYDGYEYKETGRGFMLVKEKP